MGNSRIVCEHERRGRYSNERFGASIETARKAGETKVPPPINDFLYSCYLSINYKKLKLTGPWKANNPFYLRDNN